MRRAGLKYKLILVVRTESSDFFFFFKEWVNGRKSDANILDRVKRAQSIWTLFTYIAVQTF